MRKMKSLVMLASTLAVMACQTVNASASLVTQSPIPAVHGAEAAKEPSKNQAVTASTHTKASVAAAEGSKRTWIIFGIIAAVVVAIVVITAAGGGADSIY
jgi:hypothetical protein